MTPHARIISDQQPFGLCLTLDAEAVNAWGAHAQEWVRVLFNWPERIQIEGIRIVGEK